MVKFIKSKFLNISIFVLSLVCLLISLRLFWNMGVYVDEFNTSPDVVLEGSLWIIMDWIRLGSSALICTLSVINLFKKH